MRLYLAGTHSEVRNGGGRLSCVLRPDGRNYDLRLLSRVNMLESFYYIADWQTENICHVKSFMLDSGAFSFVYGSKVQVNISEYFERYKRYVRDNDVKLFFELDIDELVGYEKVLDYRRELERHVGRQCIPVWHISRGKEEWLRMCDEYEYVAIGGIADKGRKSIEKYIPWFTSEAHRRGARVHGLGYCPLDTAKLMSTGFDSVDGTAWLYGKMGGYVEYFDGKVMRRKYTPTGKKMTNEALPHNFMQWVKMSEYLEKR